MSDEHERGLNHAHFLCGRHPPHSYSPASRTNTFGRIRCTAWVSLVVSRDTRWSPVRVHLRDSPMASVINSPEYIPRNVPASILSPAKTPVYGINWPLKEVRLSLTPSLLFCLHDIDTHFSSILHHLSVFQYVGSHGNFFQTLTLFLHLLVH